MPFWPYPLPTDLLLWLLVATGAVYAWYCTRHEHLAASWRRVFRSPAAVASLVVLALYLLVALADSIHYRPALDRKDSREPVIYAVEVRSLLDVAASHLRGRTERTYSAPLATRSFSKEQIERADGKVERDFPRLRFGGAHLKDEGARAGDIASKTMLGLVGAAVVWGLIAAGCRPLRRRFPEVPWHAALAALAAILALAGPAVSLSSGYHVLGTDKVGNDILYLSLKSIRTSIVIGTITTLVLLPLGVGLGIMAGYFRRWVDDLIQYVYTTLNSIPDVLLIVAAVLMLQVLMDKNADWFTTSALRADWRLLCLCVILGFTSWTGLARLLRGESLKLSQLEYVQAAHAFGVSHARVMTRHILPNVAHIVIIILALDFSGFVLAEAVLSYIGVGVDPSTNSFGTMINAARLEMAREPMVWWSLAAAFGFMLVLVLAANLVADAVRDAFDPRVRMAGAALAVAAPKV
jgi:peptide/nickel transport system permease protein